jgi:preprotein translocase subunit SecG
MVQTRRGMKRFMQRITIGLTVFQFLISSLAIAAVTGATAVSNSNASHPSIHRADVSKIVAVLENKIEDQSSLEKTKKKLLTLNDRQTRLIASLSDRVTQKENSTGSDIAFLLMMALITLL